MGIININSRNFKVTNYNSDIRPFEFGIYIDDITNIQKEVEIKEKIHKTDVFGHKLYKLNINKKDVEITNENDKYLDGEPIFIIKTISKNVTLIDNPTEFSLNDILEYKKKEILIKHNYEFSNCELFEIELEKLIDTSYENNSCNTGFKLIDIKPKGEVKLKFTILSEHATKIKLGIENLNIKYSINNEEFKSYENIIESNSPVKSLDLILTNNLESNLSLNSLYIVTN